MRPVLEYDDDVISGVDGYEFSHCPGVARSGQGLDGAVWYQPQREVFRRFLNVSDPFNLKVRWPKLVVDAAVGHDILNRGPQPLVDRNLP